MNHIRLFAAVAVVASLTLVSRAQTGTQPPTQPPAQPPGQPQQPSSVTVVIGGPAGLPPKYAIPDFIPLTNDSETVAAAKLMGQILWDDLNFEREVYMISRDTYRSIPQPPSIEQVPVDRWKELNADAVVAGSVQKTAKGFLVRMRLIEVATGRSVLAKEYEGATRNPRLFPHTISDDIHAHQRALQGVARTKVAFTSDRAGDLMKGPVSQRGVSNVYYVDYDGGNEQRVSLNKTLELAPVWAPDNRTIAYTSYKSGFPDIIVQPLYGGGPASQPAKGTADRQNYLAVWSPDGTKLAFTSTRDGNPEIYLVNRDGSGLRRLTNHPSVDWTPTWSPTGQQLAFTSDRGGNPNIWIMNADGSQAKQITRESHADRATWSPTPFNEIAFTARGGGGFNIKVYDFATGAIKTITDGIGSSEQPTFSPTGRHLAFSSNRAGKEQIFTIGRDGQGLRQITRTGNNKFPNWSR
jgi:TolB protein